MELKNRYYAVGAMSGTSLDGLDVALCEFRNRGKVWEFSLIDSMYTPYSKEFRGVLESAYDCNSRQLTEIDAQFGVFTAGEVNKLISRNQYSVDLVASHGQTIFHAPQKGYTCQIGSGAHIAMITGLPTVCNFRAQDVVLGGQGAPLVPVGDALLFSEFAACLNLGGFANISYDLKGTRIAYDICAVNIILNYLTGILSIEFDKDGKLAQSGILNNKVLEMLNELDFYKKGHPKSLGREWSDNYVLPLIKNLQPKDGLRTYTLHVAQQIAFELGKVPGQKILVTGGGAKNKYLMEILSQLTTKEIIIPSDSVLDFKEAIVFAFLGVLRMRNEINCLASVTGAKRDLCTGAIYLP